MTAVRRSWMALVAVALLAGGCAVTGSSSTDDVYSGGMAADVGTYCDSIDPQASRSPAGPPLPADFVPVSAQRCMITIEAVPGDGEWMVRNQQRATDGLPALAQALRLPSQQSGGGICPAIGYGPIVITLTDAAGRQVTPAIPRTVCGAPLPATLTAIKAVSWRTTGTERVNQTRSQLEIDSGCPGSYKPVVAITAADGTRRQPSGPAYPDHPQTARICRYSLNMAEELGVGNGVTVHIGRLAGAPLLTAAQLTALLAALDAAPAASPCNQPEAPFAVLHAADGSDTGIAIELGGCTRALDINGALRQLTPATVAQIPA